MQLSRVSLVFNLFIFDSFHYLLKSRRPFIEKEKGSKMILQGTVVGVSKKYWSLSQFLTFLTVSKKRSPEMSESDAKNLFHLWYCIKIEKTEAFDLETKVW